MESLFFVAVEPRLQNIIFISTLQRVLAIGIRDVKLGFLDLIFSAPDPKLFGWCHYPKH
jgi:hypothetical protein